MAEKAIPFTKAHGNGNDFVLFIADRCPATIRDEGFIVRVCDRHTGVGGDGVLILSEDEDQDVDFKMDYYNSDGSWETFCANGSRCAVKLFAREKGRDERVIFSTGDGVHKAHLLPDGQVRLQILAPMHVTDWVNVDGFQGQQVDTGAPHFATEVQEVSEELVAEAGPKIRYHPIFQPRGVNVNFFERIDPHTIMVISYEKGIEAVMRSCASGSTAACYHAAMTGDMASPVRIINPGGELLVEFDKNWKNVTVQGPAQLVFDSHLPADF